MLNNLAATRQQLIDTFPIQNKDPWCVTLGFLMSRSVSTALRQQNTPYQWCSWVSPIKSRTVWRCCANLIEFRFALEQEPH
ncbi:MAG: hypothetical protein MGG11_00040 [Trichodesmium sp. MAG_R03]|nr:hypothetical protein [Trichodesmium sp. MAG_R03]